MTAARLGLALFFLFVFLIGVKALETGISTFGSDLVDQVFSSVASPIAGLAAGVLATVLVQSSSVTTATIVGLVGSGILPVETAVPMVMGANIGTTVTNTLASLGHIRQRGVLPKGVCSGNHPRLLQPPSRAILLPLEVGFGLISKIANGVASVVGGSLPEVGLARVHQIRYQSPGDMAEEPIRDSGLGRCSRHPSARSWNSGDIPLPVDDHPPDEGGHEWSSRKRHHRILGKGAGITALFAGLVMTVAVQSSSITTSILVPLVAAGVLTLRNAFPVTLGANIGTTVTALLASIAGRERRWTGDRVGSCHLQCPRNSHHLSVAADAGNSVMAGRTHG